jgi:hypothetical protein
MENRVKEGKLKTTKKVYEAIGRIKERYPRASRYFSIDLDENCMQLCWKEDAADAKGYVCRRWATGDLPVLEN